MYPALHLQQSTQTGCMQLILMQVSAQPQLLVTEMLEPSFQKHLAAQKYIHGNLGLNLS